MNPPLRQKVLILALLGFASMASGLALQLHLAGAEDAGHHDSADCSLCQAMLGGKIKAHLETPPAVACSDDAVETIPEGSVVSPRQITPAALSPRPPPIPTA